ncbi:recombinase family protein [Terriglobus albidus]|uniref:recombinase family protein n=1 Tax=Terriglobus albidus TaxID=1592106 RepID=UPI0021E029E1|nr:recombinase family protein [Terriglobus albidus]
MPYFERVKDRISGPFSPTLITERQKAGWQLVSIEWRRELPESETPHEPEHMEEIPYGLRLSDDGLRLEIDPYENSVLMQMMDLLGQDFSYSQIVSALNERGLRTRANAPWDRVSLHKMMPRLIEVGPRLFAGDQWKSLHTRHK